MGSLERIICFLKFRDLRLAKIGAGGKPLVGDSLRTFGPIEKNLSIVDSFLIPIKRLGPIGTEISYAL